MSSASLPLPINISAWPNGDDLLYGYIALPIVSSPVGTSGAPIVYALRHPVDRLVALFNSKHGRCWAAALGSTTAYSSPLQLFRSAYARANSPGVYRKIRPPSAVCLLAGEPLATCSASAKLRAGNVSRLLETQWLQPARHRLRAAAFVVVDDFERSKRLAVAPPAVAGDDEKGDAGGAADSCSGGGGHLTREALQGDRDLLEEVKRREAADLALYAFAKRLMEERIGASDDQAPAAMPANRDAAAAAAMIDSASAAASSSSADFVSRVRRLQRARPPTGRMPIMFTHIPKCAGSTFRNQLLLEFTRLQRAPRDFACVLFRDVTFRERRSNSTIARQGPACLGADGYFRRHLIIITGHVAFHPSVLSRVAAPTFATVVFLREPLSRLVSLFNMYPDGTWGKPPPNATTPAQRFDDSYRRRLEGRNALTCFIAGFSLCDSVGAFSKAAITPAARRRARFNLAHRFDVFGLTERSTESMAIIAWAFGWLPALRRMREARQQAVGDDGGLAALFSSVRLAPGRQHRRLAHSDLCAITGLLPRMRLSEAADRELYTLAREIYMQRLALVKKEADLQAVLGTSPVEPSRAEEEPACWRDPALH